MFTSLNRYKKLIYDIHQAIELIAEDITPDQSADRKIANLDPDHNPASRKPSKKRITVSMPL